MALASASASHPEPVVTDDVITSPGPFEGPEKLLEVWFAPSPDSLPPNVNANANVNANVNGESSSGTTKANRGEGYRGLRMIPRAVWEEMLDIVKCKVLSVVEGDEVDAYLLRYVSFPLNYLPRFSFSHSSSLTFL